MGQEDTHTPSEGVKLNLEQRLNQAGIKRLDEQISQLLDSRPLKEEDVLELCNTAKTVLREEPNVLPVSIPVTVVGDIHGQFSDLKELLAISGSKSFCLFVSADLVDSV